MNILIPHEWLKEHLKTKANPETIQKNLSLCGPSVERIYQTEGEPVYDIEVTTNRVDMMSVRGIAREAASILPEFGIEAELVEQKLPTPPEGDPLDIKVVDSEKLCHRTLGIKITGVDIKPSPKWLQTRLIQVGQRPINNVIDITNYVMWELGHPIHAFDYDKLTTKKIIVREAKAGETLVTLDDKKHRLKGGEVIFDDGTGTIIDVPGIMGTKNTVISNETKNVLLWIESIDAVKIRRASMGLAIRSQAAVLNEKNVDPELGLPAILRAFELMLELTGGKSSSALFDHYPHPKKPVKTTLLQTTVDTYLGLNIKTIQIKRILENLGCGVELNKEKGEYHILPPSWRTNDLIIPQDYIEEIARIYGYFNLPSRLMATPIPTNSPKTTFKLENTVKKWLAGWGCQEVYTYSFVSKDRAEKSGSVATDHIQLKNPLSEDLQYLRRSLIPSLEAVFESNPLAKTTIFELQKTYQPQGGSTLPDEKITLSAVTNLSFAKLKGILEALFEKLYIETWEVKPKTGQLPYSGEAGEITINGKSIGEIGTTPNGLHAFELDFLSLSESAKSHPAYIPVYQTPAVIEQLTFTLPKNIHLGPVLQTIRATDPIIETVEVKDIYKDNYTFTIHYRDAAIVLSSESVSPARKKIIAAVKKHHRGELVGTIT